MWNLDSRQLKVGIIGGLISSLLVVVFIQPILSLLWRAILATGGFLHQGYIDRIYRGAAILSNNPYGEATLLFVALTLLLVGFFWVLSILKSYPSPDGFSPQFLKMADVIGLVVLLAVPAIIVVKSSVLRGTAQIADSFTQRLTILAPAISDTEYKTLKARWASMHGKADYEAIVSSMDKRATELGVTLPPAPKP